MTRPRARHGSSPSSLVGEGGSERSEEPGEGAAFNSPSPQHAARAAPFSKGEKDDRVCVAQIGAPHGVRGEVRLWPFTAEPMALPDYGVLESEDGAQSFEIETLRPAKDHLVARLRGVADREAAEQLTNTKLFVPRARLPAPDEDEFYHADLVGLPVFDADDQQLGTVTGVHNFGAGDLLEVQPAAGGATVLLTFTQAVVPVVDVAARRIVANPPAGTFDDDVAPPDEPQTLSSHPVRARSAAKRAGAD
jgi:16S rRNA processing protein RimM